MREAIDEKAKWSDLSLRSCAMVTCLGEVDQEDELSGGERIATVGNMVVALLPTEEWRLGVLGTPMDHSDGKACTAAKGNKSLSHPSSSSLARCPWHRCCLSGVAVAAGGGGGGGAVAVIERAKQLAYDLVDERNIGRTNTRNSPIAAVQPALP